MDCQSTNPHLLNYQLERLHMLGRRFVLKDSRSGLFRTIVQDPRSQARPDKPALSEVEVSR